MTDENQSGKQTIEDVLALDSGILDTFGMSVETMEDGLCVLTSRVPESLVNAGGFAHGAIQYALMDTGAAYALRSQGLSGVTINGNITYVRGGRAGSLFRATVQIANLTRRIATIKGEVTVQNEGDEEGNTEVAAHGTYIFQLRDR